MFIQEKNRDKSDPAHRDIPAHGSLFTQDVVAGIVTKHD